MQVAPLSGVVNSDGGMSDTLGFLVENPQPTASSLSPTNIDAGATGFALEISGNNFVEGSKARWNGVDLDTTFISPNAVFSKCYRR